MICEHFGGGFTCKKNRRANKTQPTTRFLPRAIRPVLSQQKNGTIFRYDFMAGGQTVPKKCFCDRIEKDGWDGHQGQNNFRGSVYL